MIEIEVRTSGPLTRHGEAAAIVNDYADAARWAVARQGFVDIGLELRRVIRQPTPYYWTQITLERASADRVRVHDQRVVYGPWLEGVGSRNYPVTRFAGYGHWRRTRQELQAKAGPIADRVLPPYLARLNGGV